MEEVGREVGVLEVGLGLVQDTTAADGRVAVVGLEAVIIRGITIVFLDLVEAPNLGSALETTIMVMDMGIGLDIINERRLDTCFCNL